MAKKAAEEIKAKLLADPPRLPVISKEAYLSLGITTLNLCVTGTTTGGVAKGQYLYYVGDSESGKTWFAMMVLAEAARNPAFAKHSLIYDPTEHGAGMDIARYFGNRLLTRIRPPVLKGKARSSRTVEELYFNLDREMDQGPCVYVIDSFDGLTADADDAKFDDDREEFEKGKLPESGSYRMNKPKAHSQNINRTRQRLVETESIFVGISQTRDAIGSPIPGAKTRSGGKALRFFADVELWTSIRGEIKKTALGKERIIGSFIEVAVRKNRATGWHGKLIPVPFLREHGMDDIGACVDFLIEERWGKKDGTIAAPEFSFEGKRETLIQRIIKEQDERELQLLVAQTWKEIEEACHLERPRRYD